jgi:hypothetical protein
MSSDICVDEGMYIFIGEDVKGSGRDQLCLENQNQVSKYAWDRAAIRSEYLPNASQQSV